MNLKNTPQKSTNRGCAGNTAEFGPAFFILIFIFIFPLINLLWFAASFVTIALAANYYVSQAAVETSYDRSLAAMYTAASEFNSSSWNFFGGLIPYSGYGGSGSDLFVKAIDINSKNVDRYGPNTKVPPPIDISGKVWEYEASVNYDAKPLFNLSSIPFINTVPGLGRPARLHYSAHKVIEHPLGLALVSALQDFAKQPDGSIAPALPPGAGGGGVLPGDGSWYNPDIYQQIQAAGQTIVRQDVLIVDSVNPEWTLSGLPIQPGQKAWIDLRADGLWSWDPANHDMIDADGYPSYGLNGPWQLTAGMLIARVGDTGAPFEVGKYELNLVPPGSGELQFIMNDHSLSGTPRHSDNKGIQAVRVIITQ